MTPEPDQYLGEGALQLGAAALVLSPALTQADLTLTESQASLIFQAVPSGRFRKTHAFLPTTAARLGTFLPGARLAGRVPAAGRPGSVLAGRLRLRSPRRRPSSPGPLQGSLPEGAGATWRGRRPSSSRTGCLSSGGSCRLKSLPSEGGRGTKGAASSADPRTFPQLLRLSAGPLQPPRSPREGRGDLGALCPHPAAYQPPVAAV